MGKLFDVAISFAMENQELADTVYHYLKAEGLSVFYAPAPECQSILSGENQREIFYRIFGLESKYVTKTSHTPNGIRALKIQYFS